MKNGKRTILFIFFFICFIPFLAQNKSNKALSSTSDSLKLVLKNAKHDSTRCNTLIALMEIEGNEDVLLKYNNQLKLIAESNFAKLPPTSPEYKVFGKFLAEAFGNLGSLYFNRSDIPKTLDYFYKSLKICQAIQDKESVAVLFNNLGDIYKIQGDISKALDFYFRCLKIREKNNDKVGIAQSFSDIGLIYDNKGDIAKALEYYGKSLKIREDIGDKDGLANSFNNIATLYDGQGDKDKALLYFSKSLKIREDIGDKTGSTIPLINIGIIYKNKGNISTALNYLHKSLKIQEEDLDNVGMGYSLNIIGELYRLQGDFSEALKYFNKSLKIREDINDKTGIANSFISIGEFYLLQKNYKKAQEFCSKSLNMSKELGFPKNIKRATEALTKIYKATGNHKLALENYELFIQMRDSINNIETQKASIKQQAKYDYEQKKALEDAEHRLQMKEQKERSAAEKNKQNIIISSVSLILLLVIVFSVFLYNRFKITQKQKVVIELKEKETTLQKQIIEEKHKEITDSINYAERIQRSFLATTEMFDENLNDYFVYFKPKDIVSGDFYWAASVDLTTNKKFMLCTADSTGHGVPGAIMSLLNITSLEKAIETEISPDKILNVTRQTIIDRLKRDGSNEGGKDGMDCSLLSFDFETLTLNVAAANNPVWIVRNSNSSTLEETTFNDPHFLNTLEVIEIKPDKMPVGKHDKENIPFSLKEIKLLKGDIIYTLTDGYSDQFGGETGKKFMSKNLRKLLISNSQLPMQKQKEILEITLRNWMGDLEQIDDVTIIGIKV